MSGVAWVLSFDNLVGAHQECFGDREAERLEVAAPHAIDPLPGGLWALGFGTGGNNGSPDTLYFTDGINREVDGLRASGPR